MSAFRLTVIEPGEPDPATFHLSGQDQVIGRDPSADLVVGAASVSGRHGLFKPTANGYAFTDLSSTNGSALLRAGSATAEGLPGGQAVPVQAGDTLLLGDQKAPVVVRIEASVAAFDGPAGGQRTIIARAPLADLLGALPQGAGVEAALEQLAARALAAKKPEELLQAGLAFLTAVAPRASERGMALWGPYVACQAGDEIPSGLRKAAWDAEKQAVLLDDSDGAALPQTGSIVGKGMRAALLVPLASGGVSWGVLYAAATLGVVALPQSIVPSAAVAGPLLALAAAQLSARREDQARRAALETENAQLFDKSDKVDKAEADPVGQAPTFVEALKLARQVASADVPVLILGETGTGKEVLARALHRWSRRADHAFVPFNCAAVPEKLIESELFGHMRGSFPGATADRRGLFEEANGGTVFLDEIGEMPALMQAKLLRVLQEGEVRRVGASKAIRVDVRVLSATHRDLQQMVAEGRFRADLMYRMNAVTIRLPALRERGDDVALLAHFLLGRAQRQARKRVAGFAADALWALSTHRFPGNVRELENEILRAVALTTEGESIHASAFSEGLRGGVPASFAPAAGEVLPLKDVVARAERVAIDDALQRSKGNVSEAARVLGLTRPGLYKAMERLGIR